MFIFAFFLLCITQPFYVFGKREPLPRYLKEDGVKSPIFGSYSYDPVKQVFEPPPVGNDTLTPAPEDHNGHPTGHVDTSSTHPSTVIGNATESERTTVPQMFRKGIASPLTIKPTVWWLRPKVIHFKDDRNLPHSKGRRIF